MSAFDADRSVGPRVGENLRKEVKIVGTLSPWCAYEFRVIAANEYGPGQPSAPSPQYNTHPEVPFFAPRNVGGGGGKTNTLTITWDVSCKRRCPYSIKYKTNQLARVFCSLYLPRIKMLLGFTTKYSGADTEKISSKSIKQ